MTTLSPSTRTVLNQLKAFKPTYFGNSPDPVWSTLPFTRRASVLVLLFEARTHTNQVTLSTVLTRRGHGMSSFSGQVALPGGKADDEHETPYMVSRREAYEEIALPLESAEIEYVATLPTYLARNMLGVVPTVAYLSSPARVEDLPLSFQSDSVPEVLHPVREQLKNGGPVDETAEVAEIFSLALEDLLHEKLANGLKWHQTKPAHWGGLTWPINWYSVPRMNKKVGEPSHFEYVYY